MKQVTMHEAKTHLSRLVDMALAGEDIVIARRDQPLVRLVVITEGTRERRIGGLPDLIKSMGEDFNAPIEDWCESPIPEAGSARMHRKRKRR